MAETHSKPFYDKPLESLVNLGYVPVGVPAVIHGFSQHPVNDYEDALKAEKENKGLQFDSIAVYLQNCAAIPNLHVPSVQPNESPMPIKKLDIAVVIALREIKKGDTAKLR